MATISRKARSSPRKRPASSNSSEDEKSTASDKPKLPFKKCRGSPEADRPSPIDLRTSSGPDRDNITTTHGPKQFVDRAHASNINPIDVTRGRSKSLGETHHAGESASSQRPAMPVQTHYLIMEDELLEHPSLLPASEASDTDDTVPICRLSDFSIYNLMDMSFVHIADLARLRLDANSSPRNQYGGSGIIFPALTDEDEDEDADDDDSNLGELHLEQHVQLTEILEFNLYDLSVVNNRLFMDRNIYIRTRHAWYILDDPSEDYRPYFSDFFLKHHLFCLFMSEALASTRLSYFQFLKKLKTEPDFADPDGLVGPILQRELTQEDIECDETRSFIIGNLSDLELDQDVCDFFKTVRIIKDFRSRVTYEVSTPSSSRSSSPSTTGAIRKLRSRLHPPRFTDPEKAAVEFATRTRTYTTPAVYSVVASYFKHKFESVGASYVREDFIEATNDNNLCHYQNPGTIRWIGSPEGGRYMSAKIDSVEYHVGDCISVLPGKDDDPTRKTNARSDSARTTSTLATNFWFLQILYFFEAHGKKRFHGRWFEHGSKTFLQDIAGVNELFVLQECTDLDVECIFQKQDIHYVSGVETPSDKLYYRFTYNRDKTAFVDVAEPEFSSQPPGSCPVCDREDNRGHGPGTYHMHDFVYIIPDPKSDGRYRIGQITDMRSRNHVKVRLFVRSGEVSHANDEKLLVKTSAQIRVAQEQLDGICYVFHGQQSDLGGLILQELVHEDDHFYVFHQLPDTDPLQRSHTPPASTATPLVNLPLHEWTYCKHCLNDHIMEISQAKSSGQPALQGLDLFAGAGGLSVGLEMSQYVEAKWAVELSPGAARTYRSNHPNAIVYNQCVNRLLERTVNCFEGQCSKPLESLDGSGVLPDMPTPGEVHLIFGGPPCQSFSRANRFKKPDDVRSTLLTNFFSWVEYFQPKYFLLENVVGLLSSTLRNDNVEGGKREIHQGIAKLVLRLATSLGYQVRFNILSASDYGAPQARERVIFIGARTGIPLPDFPLPTHLGPRRVSKIRLETGDYLHALKRPSDKSYCDIRCAPLGPVTVNDAIGDLPAFEWTNPFGPPSSSSSSESGFDRKSGGRHHIQIFSGIASPSSRLSGFRQPTEYRSAQRTAYQQTMRARNETNLVTEHYTRTFGPVIVNRVINVPLQPGADHDDLPKRLQEKPVESAKTKTAVNVKSFRGTYGRLDGDGLFRTLLTTLKPYGQPGGMVLHPTQRRILTIREYARAQGFPDDYVFESVRTDEIQVFNDKIRQIGNAVPIPLGRALGKAIGASMQKVWAQREREGSVEL